MELIDILNRLAQGISIWMEQEDGVRYVYHEAVNKWEVEGLAYDGAHIYTYYGDELGDIYKLVRVGYEWRFLWVRHYLCS